MLCGETFFLVDFLPNTSGKTHAHAHLLETKSREGGARPQMRAHTGARLLRGGGTRVLGGGAPGETLTLEINGVASGARSQMVARLFETNGVACVASCVRKCAPQSIDCLHDGTLSVGENGSRKP